MIYIIIVTFNGSKWIEKCLYSILISSIQENKIIVIDNNSSDDTINKVNKFQKTEFLEILLIRNNENLGFGKANNIGIKKALELGAEYVFLLNQDTWIFENTIDLLMKASKQYEDKVLISPIHLSNDEETLDLNFSNYYSKKKGENDFFAELKFVNAAAWFMSVEIFKKVGFFEEFFSHYGEDRNFVYRLQYHKIKIIVAKKARICHDRFIVRKFEKDLLQSRYLILSEILNINFPIFQSYLRAFKYVFGLPKFFFKNYKLKLSLIMFFELFIYFFNQFFFLRRNSKVRKTYL